MQGGVSLSPVGFDDLSLSFGGRLCDCLCGGPSLGFVCSHEHGDDAHSQGLHIFSSSSFGSVGSMIGDVTDSLIFLFSLPFVVGGLGAVTGQEHGRGHSQGVFSPSLVVFEGVGPSGSGGSVCLSKFVLSIGSSVSLLCCEVSIVAVAAAHNLVKRLCFVLGVGIGRSGWIDSFCGSSMVIGASALSSPCCSEGLFPFLFGWCVSSSSFGNGLE